MITNIYFDALGMTQTNWSVLLSKMLPVLDELDDATRATTLHLDASSALAKVFVIVLTEDERRVGHFRKHIARRLPEAELFKAFTGEKDALGTAGATPSERHAVEVGGSLVWTAHRRTSTRHCLGLGSTNGQVA